MPWRKKYFVRLAAFHFATYLVLAAWCSHNYLRSSVNALCKSIIGGGVAGVKGNKHVEFVGIVAVDCALGKVQSVESRFLCIFVAKFHHVVANLDARDFGLAFESVGKVVV